MLELLAGLRVLVLEDEFLIAMDIEQVCRDHGAADVQISRTVPELDPDDSARGFDVAILDLMLGGQSTIAFAGQLRERRVPFIFASGYSDPDEVHQSFPGVSVVGKPFSGTELVTKLAAASGREPLSRGV